MRRQGLRQTCVENALPYVGIPRDISDGISLSSIPDIWNEKSVLPGHFHFTLQSH